MPTISNDVPEWTHTAALIRCWDALLESRSAARRPPPPRGVDGLGASAFADRKLQHCAEMSRILQRSGPEGEPTAYRFAPLIEHERETEPGKLRRVYIPRIRDQIVLRAIYQKLSLAMQAVGLEGALRSPQEVVRDVIHAREQGCQFVVRIDIRGFYDSVRHDVLAQQVSRLGLDAVSASLLDQLVQETPHRPVRGTRADNAVRTCGLPTGVSVATLLAELYLAPLDALAERLDGVRAFRFVDDIILLAERASALPAATQQLSQAAEALSLELHGAKTRFSSFYEGFDFLGFHFRGNQLHVSPERIHKWKRRFEVMLRGISRAHADAEPAAKLQAVLDAFNPEISGAASRHISYYAIVDDLEPYRDMDAYLRRMLGGLARRAGVPLTLESAHGWAWRYKRDPDAAAVRAQQRFP